MNSLDRKSELAFRVLLDSPFGNFTRIIWNGKRIFEDLPDGVYFNDNLVSADDIPYLPSIIIDTYGDKKIYNFYCRIVDFHHTELYVDGEE